jgi:hypothetical protein
MKKQCIKCSKKQELINFHNQKASKDGKSPYCKCCHKEYGVLRRQKNKKKINQFKFKFKFYKNSFLASENQFTRI